MKMSVVKFTQKAKKIPTYVPYPDEKNPIFYENRNNQGATGRIFPLPLCDRLEADHRDVEYNALCLENEYIDVTMLPELGGRIYSALDKTNSYDFIYKNQKIKPQQIGLCGPWISGGIEFNWPQHHRPTTFKSVDWNVEKNEDGSITVWMGEIEPFNRTKGMVGVTVYPDKSYIKAKIRIFNRTPYPQTFMWWANLAVAVGDDWKAVFPEDIHWASGHAWASTSKFPVIDGMYRGYVDFGEGTDVRIFPNVPTADSFFTYNSKYDFLSGYDFGKDKGIVHVADRHISPGKKMFTWGVSDFSRAWYKNLSDDDGPYVELMTGVYTCNQPDFSWIMPYEYKTAEQYWYPIREIGEVKNATIYGAVGFDVKDGKLEFALNVTEKREACRVLITCKEQVIYEKTAYIAPDSPFRDSCSAPESEIHEFEITLYANDGKKLVSYRPEKAYDSEVQPPLAPSPKPQELNQAEEAYIHALHIYQYRHPYYDPLEYLDRALELDENHVNSNILYGKILMQYGDFEGAKKKFERAIAVSTLRNPHPYDTEPYYNMGILLKLMGEYDQAYENLFNAVWSFANKSSGYYALAEIDCLRGDFETALINIEESINANGTNFKAFKLKAMILRRLKQYDEAQDILDKLIAVDKLDFISLYEKIQLLKEMQEDTKATQSELCCVMRNIPEYYIDIALDYANAGFYQEAIEILELCDKNISSNFPVADYYRAYYLGKSGDSEAENEVLRLSAGKAVEGCLHSRLDSIPVLYNAVKKNPEDAVAPYLLGNIYYGSRNFMEGIYWFEISVERKANFPTAYRNLAIGYFNKHGKYKEAGALLEKAFAMNKTDARVFFELTQYYRSVGVDVKERLAFFEKYPELVETSDDAYTKLAATYTEAGNYDKAKDMLLSRIYHPYEGGEGVVSVEYFNVNFLRTEHLLKTGDAPRALKELEDAERIPENFNTGKLPFVHPHAHTDYYKGLAYEMLGQFKRATECFENATKDLCATVDMNYYVGLSYIKLNREEKAEEHFHKLINIAEEMIANKGRYAYFTKSLVKTLPFEHDTERNDKTMACYYLGLAYLGLGDKKQAKEAFEDTLKLKKTMYMAKKFLKDL